MGLASDRRSGVCGPATASTAVPRRPPGERAVRTTARIWQVDAAGVRRITPPARRQVLVDLERHGDGWRVLPPGVVEDETGVSPGPMQRRHRHDALLARSDTWGARPRREQPWSSGRVGGMSRTYVRRLTVATARGAQATRVRPDRIRRPCADCGAGAPCEGSGARLASWPAGPGLLRHRPAPRRPALVPGAPVRAPRGRRGGPGPGRRDRRPGGPSSRCLADPAGVHGPAPRVRTLHPGTRAPWPRSAHGPGHRVRGPFPTPPTPGRRGRPSGGVAI